MAAPSPSPSLADVNGLPAERFAALFGNAVELCEEAARHVAGRRPFASVDQLAAAFAHYLDDLDEEQRIGVLLRHPDLAARLGAPLTAESASEQRGAGLQRLSRQQREALQAHNERYKSKFGFPFIICARENKLQSIMDGLQSRYNNSKEEEVVTGINEVKKICKLRILDIVK